MRAAPDRLQRLPPNGVIGWHEHRNGYAAIVLEGGYIEFGEGGCREARAGDVIVHLPFSGHANRLGRDGAVVANFVLGHVAAFSLRTSSVADPERLVREVQHDADALAAALARPLPPPRPAHVADRLAAQLDAGKVLLLREWAASQAVSSRQLLRQFRQRYALSPARYRARVRARRAWCALMHTQKPLTELAYELGFSDQAHMSRAVRALTGKPPSAWRSSSFPPCVTLL